MLRIIESITAELEADEPNGRGMRSIDMRKLPETVLLAGPNGGGKTRLLTVLYNCLIGQPAPPSFREGTRYDPSANVRVVQVPGAQDGPAASQLLPGNMSSVRSVLRKGAVDHIMSITAAQQAVAVLLSDYLDSQNPLIEAELEAEEIAIRRGDWEGLSERLSRVMGVRLGYQGRDRVATIDGRPLDHAFGMFSMGQRKLFSFIVGMAQRDAQPGVDLVMFDEPETYLHPSASIELLQGIQRVLDKGQLWVATHSPMILAALGWENVWWAENGNVSFAGRHTGRIVDGLVGGAENLLRLRALLSEPDKSAISQFVFQCLCDPPSAPLVKADPQFNDVTRRLASRDVAVQHVLDWGAQQGRFAYWLAGQDEPLRGRIDYRAYDVSDEHAGVCRKSIEALHGVFEGRYATSVSEIQEMVGSGEGFDAVLLCNVLHEISPSEWPPLFADIRSVLASNGRLLIAEDLELPVGELPTAHGFILLTGEACRALFQDSASLILCTSPSDGPYAKRLACYEVPAVLLAQVTIESICNALVLVQKHALGRLQSIRASGERSYRAGNLHGLYLAQYGNVALALESLK